MQTNGQIREDKGQWLIHWEGVDVVVSKEDAAALRAQTELPVKTSSLQAGALDWATALALQYKPRVDIETTWGQLQEGGIVGPTYESYFVVAYFNGNHYGEFRPGTNPAQASAIFDTYRVCTEIAGDGWAALVNDCFCPATYAKSMKGETRVVAGLRAVVRDELGDTVQVPVEFLPPAARLAALRTAVIA